VTARVTIDLAAYERNLTLLRERVAPAEMMAIVKSNAYGHGLVPVAKAAVRAGITSLGALDIVTALELREAGFGLETMLFAWLIAPGDDIDAAVAGDIDLGISSLRELESVAAASSTAGRRARAHLKIDTGLHRNGVTAEDWPAVLTRALELVGSVEIVGIWTHIAEASEREDSDAIERFERAVAHARAVGVVPRLLHVAASAAAFSRADARFDVVRIGAFGYGISPGGGITAAELGLNPVMTLSSPVVSATDGTGVIALGAGDGISSHAAGRVSVELGGRRHRVVEIGLEQMRIDDPDGVLRVGDEALLFGSGANGGPTLQEWADATDTIGEEIVTRLGDHLPRHYL
jgi:alanine racemase